MKINFCSDLHLEQREYNFKNLCSFTGDVLCLAGDIIACGSIEEINIFKAFLDIVCKKYLYVIHIAGNHEYYVDNKKNRGTYTMDYINNLLKNLHNEYPNYYYLNMDSIIITHNRKKYKFIGATLWTKIPIDKQHDIYYGMNDYVYIHEMPNIPLKMKTMQSIHVKHKNFIVKEAFKKNADVIILLTHHKPVFEADPNSNHPNTINGYETDLVSFISGSYIKYAIHGHTHQHYDKTINGIRYMSNPKGYPCQRTLYNPNWVLYV